MSNGCAEALAKAMEELTLTKLQLVDVKKQNAELEKNAHRYIFLKDPYRMDGPAIYAEDDCYTWLTGDEADAEIDKAMEEHK